MGFAGAVVCSGNLTDKVAIAVDTQMDDQVSATGQVRSFLQVVPNPAMPTLVAIQAAGNAYAETGSNQYLLCKLT